MSFDESTDGCNTCTCIADGSVGCTKKACSKGCTYDGKTYGAGDKAPGDRRLQHLRVRKRRDGRLHGDRLPLVG